MWSRLQAELEVLDALLEKQSLSSNFHSSAESVPVQPVILTAFDRQTSAAPCAGTVSRCNTKAARERSNAGVSVLAHLGRGRWAQTGGRATAPSHQDLVDALKYSGPRGIWRDHVSQQAWERLWIPLEDTGPRWAIGRCSPHTWVFKASRGLSGFLPDEGRGTFAPCKKRSHERICSYAALTRRWRGFLAFANFLLLSQRNRIQSGPNLSYRSCRLQVVCLSSQRELRNLKSWMN